MLKILKKIITIKLVFTKPYKKKVLVYDRTGERFYNLFFSKKDYEILDVRYESLNMYVMLLALIKFGIKNLKDNYKKCFIDIVSPRIVFTCIDNNPAFYKLKNIYSKPYYVSFQNGMRDDKFAKKCRAFYKKNKEKLRCDHIFVFGDNEKKRLSKFIDAEIHPLGNTVNNSFYKKRQVVNKVKSILYISIFKVQQKHLAEDKKIFNFLINFCKRKNIKLSFGSKLGADKEFFFRKNLNKGSWTYLSRVNPSKTYGNVHKHEMMVFNISTLGFEALAKGIKCVALGEVFPIYYNYKKYPKSGSFWTNSKKLYDIEKTINRVINFSSKSWSQIADKYSSEIMNYDPHNYKTNKILQGLLKKNN
ncbi:hypothetical protein N8084_02715 [Pelagibacteraceae bacterium]|jgi:surface carbohydrate biosynthesis protein|nr:hypothetical protein [Pelagibacteraceae bacterium]